MNQLWDTYFQLEWEVKNDTGHAESNNEIRIFRQAKEDTKGFVQLYKTTWKDTVGLLPCNSGSLLSDEGITDALNKYFLIVFSQYDASSIPCTAQVLPREKE